MPVDPSNLQQILVFLVAGALGGLANLIIEHEGRLLFPEWIKRNGRVRGLALGFLGNILAGAAVAIVADTDFLFAFGSAFAGSYAYTKLSANHGHGKEGKRV